VLFSRATRSPPENNQSLEHSHDEAARRASQRVAVRTVGRDRASRSANARDKGCSTPPCTIITSVAPIYAYNSAGIGQYALTVATATNLTPPTGATIAQICVETAPVRYRDDGIAPTASVGIPLAAGWCGPYAGPLSAIQFIAQSGSPTIGVFYYYSD
jgi:hypothetical protein